MATNAPVTGMDGHNPIYDENSTWRQWGIDDVWLGSNGLNLNGLPRFVAKVNDYVIRPTTHEQWRVVAVDQITLVPKLEPTSPYTGGGTMTEDEILFGVGPGSQAQLLRVYINNSFNPPKMTVDTHCFVGGSANAYAIIYRGGDPSMGGEPVSRMYNNSGGFLGVEVPLQSVVMDSHDTSLLKIVQECWTNAVIEDGEALTVVFYSSGGIVQSKAMLLAENTTYIHGPDIQRKFVTGISLESPWMSSSDPNVLQYPLNIPANAVGMMGVVNYSSGPPLKLPVDGTKFSMLGMDGFISSIPGEKFDLVLRYALSEDELSYAGQGMYVDRFVTEPYSVVTLPIEPGYTLKLFPYPFWDDALQGYRLKFWMYNLARNSYQEVTDLIQYSTERPGFDPRGWGLQQRMQVNLNLRKVSSAYMPMIHTQMFDVTLFGPPQESDTPWLVNTQLSPGTPGFGRAVYAKRIDQNQFYINGGYDKKEDWLKAYYYDSEPIVDRRSEGYAPEPTDFWVSGNMGATWTRYFLDDSWKSLIRVQNLVENYKSILIRFTRPGTSGPIELSMAALTIRP